MKIIVLGMDNTGKTTLCHLLSKEFNYDVYKFVDMNNSRENMIKNIKSKLNKDKIIFERFSFFDEIIYGKILRKNSLFSIHDDIYSEIVKCHPLIIYCRPKRKFILNWQNRKQMEGVCKNSLKLISEYDNLFKHYLKKDFDSFVWNYKKDDFSRLKKIIRRKYENQL